MEFEAIPKRLNVKTTSPPPPPTERDRSLEPSNKVEIEDTPPAVSSNVADPAPASPEVEAPSNPPTESEGLPSEDPVPDESSNSDDANDAKAASAFKDQSGAASAASAPDSEGPVPPPQTPPTPPSPPEPLVEHEHYWCDICDVRHSFLALFTRTNRHLLQVNPIKGPRYRCIDAACAHFDFCQKCFDEKLHNQDHKVVRIVSPKESKKLDMTVSPNGPSI
jgi:hypothetical protein